MAYNITLSNSTALIAGGLPDGQIDTANSSLTLVGKNYPGYGLFLNQNMVRLMENFANSSAPTAPLPGQIWWDTSSKYLKLNVSSTKGTANVKWKTIVTMASGGSAPDNPVTGEQWWDTTNLQLKVWDGSASWKVIGPAATANTGNTGAIPDTIQGTQGSTVSTFVVLKFYIDNTLVGIWSKESSFSTSIPGFTSISRGLNLSQLSGAVHTLYGSADVANNLNISGISIPASQFLRNNQSGTINGYLSLTNDAGLTIGAAGNFQSYVSSGDVILRNTSTNGNIILNINQSGSQIPMLKANAISGLMETYGNPTTGSAGFTVATKSYVDTVLGGGTGTSTFNASIVPGANLTYNLGSPTVWWNNIYGTAIHAQYADLAERFASDHPYDPGTVVALGGVKEITAVVEELSEDVFGVISTNAAYLMNSGAGDNESHPPVAVQGRVPVKVVGKVRKGDRLVSAGNGLARAANKNELSPWNVIGRSLQNKLDDDEGIIEAIVKLNS
ncbi:hypothetical protein UFOVP257_433 [uncultured Caudovirales phage]|uniref:Uncharacterized protein n=1 Tax=uncultured Caudovirales phage TaxID=2100421 RepID=A0A6J5LHN6_9CAUD|nr:hypothetical protein UFOVP257_433 [uncultured Caudovirales phage]